MAGRSCQSCRHYEPAPLWRRGWCRNPRLYSPQQSHLVDETELGCGFGMGTYWEATEDVLLRLGRARQPLQLARAQFRLGAKPGVSVAMSTGSSFGTGGGSNRGNRGDDPWTPSSSRSNEPDEQPSTYSAPRSERTARPAGQERTVSYQPEERYWTDYLRVALPVVGLLLMLGLFLFWANQLISPGGGSDEPTVVIGDTGNSNVIGASSPEATVTVEPQLTANPATQPTTAPADQNGAEATATSAPAAEATATEAPADTSTDSGGGAIAVGSDVQTNDSNVNVRDDATTDGNIVDTLDAGVVMTVVAGPTTADNYDWYQVEFENASGETVQGWVASDFIEPS